MGVGMNVTAQDVPFALEFIMANGRDGDVIPLQLRRLPLSRREPTGTGFCVSVGRHHQPEFFEAWLPDLSQRSCISRKAFDVAWTAGSDRAVLTACGTNPLSVDGKVSLGNLKSQD